MFFQTQSFKNTFESYHRKIELFLYFRGLFVSSLSRNKKSLVIFNNYSTLGFVSLFVNSIHVWQMQVIFFQSRLFLKSILYHFVLNYCKWDTIFLCLPIVNWFSHSIKVVVVVCKIWVGITSHKIILFWLTH